MNELKKNLIPTERFDYNLPPELISQKPTKPRDQARLLILDHKSKKIQHKKFYNIVDYFNPGDVLVLNDSKVIPARLIGHKETDGEIEVFLLRKIKSQTWQVLIRGRIKEDQKISFFPPHPCIKKVAEWRSKKIFATIVKKTDNENIVKFNCSDKQLFLIGETPTPPYIKKKAKLADYQTIYAKTAGSVAAPTAGLHFTKSLLAKLKKKGVKIEYITLHVGLGTFSPVKSQYIQDHQIHSECASINKSTADRLNQAKRQGHKIIACGTTTVRALEAFTKKSPSLSRNGLGEVCCYHLVPDNKLVNIFIYPGYKFKFIDSMITNFHLPKSSLIMLVSALAGEKLIKTAYQKAIAKKYQFYSFGDAMLII